MEQYLDYGVLGLTIFALISYSTFVTIQWNSAVNERVKATEARLRDADARLQDAKDYVKGSEEMKNATQLAASAIEANTRAVENLARVWGK